MIQGSLFPAPAPTAGVAMPAITLWQPWASLIFAGAKVHETRSWRIPAMHVGARVAIHAAAVKPPEDMISQELDDLCTGIFGWDWRNALPRGAVLGTCVLRACRATETVSPGARGDDLASGVWTPGRRAWPLEDVHALPAPVPAKGRQGFWRWTPTEAS